MKAPLILRSPEERKWLDENGDKKLEIYKEFGSEVVVMRPASLDDVLDDIPALKLALLGDLQRQAKMAVGITADAPLSLHVQILGPRGAIKASAGTEQRFLRGSTLATAFASLTYELPQFFSAKLARPFRRYALRGGGYKIRVTFGLIYDQTTIKRELMRAAQDNRPKLIEKRVAEAPEVEQERSAVAEPAQPAGEPRIIFDNVPPDEDAE